MSNLAQAWDTLYKQQLEENNNPSKKTFDKETSSN